jgi:L,D-peptidoglycan transpeptidase YkuD (ErfK/YbiS/YcfS/YnhG family)
MADLLVHTLNCALARGRVSIGGLSFACAIGRSGQSHIKREGDGRTPIGCWRIEQIFWRGDRRCRPGAVLRFLPGRSLRQDDGWCDAAGDANYNRHVRHPYGASAERLWRHDHLYDLVLVLSHNRRPRVKGRGSAIFLHIAGTHDDGGLAATEGCVALARHDLEIVLMLLRRGSHVRIGK